MEINICCKAFFLYKKTKEMVVRFNLNASVNDQHLAKVLLNNCVLSNQFYHDYFSQGTKYFSTDFDRAYLNGDWFKSMDGSSYRIKRFDNKDLLFKLMNAFNGECTIERLDGYRFSNYDSFFDAFLTDVAISFKSIRRPRYLGSMKVVSFCFDLDDLALINITTI